MYIHHSTTDLDVTMSTRILTLNSLCQVCASAAFYAVVIGFSNARYNPVHGGVKVMKYYLSASGDMHECRIYFNGESMNRLHLLFRRLCNKRVNHLTCVIVGTIAILALSTRVHSDSRIIDATKHGNLAHVKALLKDHPGLVSTRGAFGMTPLHMAAAMGRSDITALLLKDKANVNAKDTVEGLTPLHYAAQQGHAEIAKLLLANKANVNAKEIQGMTPLHYAAGAGHTDVAKLLLANKANVDAVDNYGLTPLYYAADGGYTRLAALLLAHKATVDFRDKDGKTPLAAAAAEGHKEVARLLLANNAAINSVDNAGKTPLDLAASNEHTSMMELLRQHGGHK